MHRTQTADPHGVLHDLHKTKDIVEANTWNILWKMHSKIQNHAFQIEGLNDQVGSSLTSADYFLNGQTEPQTFTDDQSVTENILGLKNSIQRNRKLLDNHISKAIKNSSKMGEKLDEIEFRTPSNALPKAEITKLKKDIAEELAKSKSLASGNAFNNLDLTNRIVDLEQSQIRAWGRIDAVGKTVSIIKKRTDPETEDLPENKAYELDRIR